MRGMRDPEIRAALVDHLRRTHPDPIDNRILPEMSIGLGASRIDVGLVNGMITGHEIKSPSDNLDRLPRQILHYGRCLDRAVIVTSERRASTIQEHVPEWWGVTIAYDRKGAVRLRRQRRPRRNPGLVPFYVAQLLWRDEAYAELESRGLHHGLARATRWVLWDRLSELPIGDLRTAVRARLKARPAC
jgi:hypothetical protein